MVGEADCLDALEAPLLIQGGVHWGLETLRMFWFCLCFSWGLMASYMFCDGFQGGRKIPTAKISFRLGVVFVGVRGRWFCFCKVFKAVARHLGRTLASGLVLRLLEFGVIFSVLAMSSIIPIDNNKEKT